MKERNRENTAVDHHRRFKIDGKASLESLNYLETLMNEYYQPSLVLPCAIQDLTDLKCLSPNSKIETWHLSCLGYRKFFYTFADTNYVFRITLESFRSVWNLFFDQPGLRKTVTEQNYFGNHVGKSMDRDLEGGWEFG